jgi:ABC-type Mn2+/Zn2+ transport system ATPase subunit
MKFSYCRHRHGKTDPHAPALEVHGLEVVYPQTQKLALKDISLSISSGTTTALVGPNGAGKSTLFKAVTGLLPVRSGDIRIFGASLDRSHHKVVYLPQRSEIDWQFPMSVLDLVLTGRYVHLGWFRQPGKKDLDLARKALQEMDALDLAQRQIGQLSGGQQQRTLIARALAQNADLLLLDEPLNAVDAETRQCVTALIQKIKAQGKTVMVATHYYDQGEARYDSAVYLRDGQQIRAADIKNTEEHRGHSHS